MKIKVDFYARREKKTDARTITISLNAIEAKTKTFKTISLKYVLVDQKKENEKKCVNTVQRLLNCLILDNVCVPKGKWNK
jgi:hypothetical protein